MIKHLKKAWADWRREQRVKELKSIDTKVLKLREKAKGIREQNDHD